MPVGGLRGGLAVVGVGAAAVLELAPHLEERGGRGGRGRLRARRGRRGGRGEEEGGGVEGGDRVEAREREQLRLAVPPLHLALHGGEHLLGLARDPAAEEARLPPPPPRRLRLVVVGPVAGAGPSAGVPRDGARGGGGGRRGVASAEVVADEVLQVPPEVGRRGAHPVVVVLHACLQMLTLTLQQAKQN